MKEKLFIFMFNGKLFKEKGSTASGILQKYFTLKELKLLNFEGFITVNEN